jgi:hypothetical protein
MKNSIFNSFITAAAFSLAFGLSSHAAAEQNPEQAVANGLSNEQFPFGTMQSLDASNTETVLVAGVMAAIEEQDGEANIQAQNRAEALYQRHSLSGSLPALPSGPMYESVAVAW